MQQISSYLGVTHSDKECKEKNGVNNNWVHFLKDMVFSGQLRSIGCYGLTILLTVKAHTDLRTGSDAFPSIQTISHFTGISEAQIKRELKKLCELNYIEIVKKGRSNHYIVKERLKIKYEDGSTATASWNYVAFDTQNILNEIKKMFIDNTLRSTSVINITVDNQKINQVVNGVQINNYGNSTNNLSIEQHQAFIENIDDPIIKTAYQKNLDFQKKLSTLKT